MAKRCFNNYFDISFWPHGWNEKPGLDWLGPEKLKDHSCGNVGAWVAVVESHMAITL